MWHIPNPWNGAFCPGGDYGNDADVGANQAVVSNGNFITVQYGQIIIRIKMAANMDVVAKVTMKRLFNTGILWWMV